MIDRFLDDRPPGGVIGTVIEGGIVRKGVDREGVLGIDNGALRIQPLIKSGWARSGIAYGPYARENGLAFGVFLTNGHTFLKLSRSLTASWLDTAVGHWEVRRNHCSRSS